MLKAIRLDYKMVMAMVINLVTNLPIKKGWHLD